MKNVTLFKTKIILLIAIIICILLGMFVTKSFYIASALLSALLFFIFLMPVWNHGQMTRLEAFEKGAKK